MSKIIKKAEVKAEPKKEDTKAVVVVKKTLTPIKKDSHETTEAKLKEAAKSPANTGKTIIMATQTPKAEEPKTERPVMPANFCMDPKDWEGVGVCYDADSNNCRTCEKDFPETLVVCKARSEFLGVTAKAGKTAKAKKTGEKAVRTNKSGKTPQSLRIDEMLKAEMALSEMVTTLAAADFGGDTEAGKKAAQARVDSHLKSIRTKTYCRAALMAPFLSYLNPTSEPAPKKK